MWRESGKDEKLSCPSKPFRGLWDYSKPCWESWITDQSQELLAPPPVLPLFNFLWYLLWLCYLSHCDFFCFQSFLASVLWGLCSTLSRSDGLRSFASLGVTRYWLALLRFSRSSPWVTVQGRQPVGPWGPFHKPFHCENISFIKLGCINWVHHSLCILMLFCCCSPLVKQFIVHHGCFDLGLWEM